LKTTDKAHPGAEEVIANGETDWRKVVERLTGPIPDGKRILYQKQMTHHLLPEIDREWIVNLTNCFLIRDPREVILSYIKKNPEPTLEDLGFVQQEKIFDFVVGTSRRDVRGRRSAPSLPIVIDAKDVLESPERMLRLFCAAIGVEFDDAMLSWPPGLRDTDGVWAKYWYDDVARSTSFQPYEPKEGVVPDRLRELYQQCRQCYERLYQHRLL
ncbi:MAG: sulfotransferase family protein, partial [Verrucomicrobia bacterium]